MGKEETTVITATEKLPVGQLQPLVSNGWTAEEVIVDRDLIRYGNNKTHKQGDKHFCCCPNCGERISLGSTAMLMRDRKRMRRALVCNSACQRQYRLAGIAYRVFNRDV